MPVRLGGGGVCINVSNRQSGDCNQHVVGYWFSTNWYFVKRKCHFFREKKSAYLHPVPGLRSTHEALKPQFHVTHVTQKGKYLLSKYRSVERAHT